MSLYRKYRPQNFNEVVGQEHIKTTLENALQSGKFSHAYLFCGPKGSGKTTTARLLAKALNCTGRKLEEGQIEPCNTCSSCLEITAGNSIDVIEIDAASNRGIDEIRELREKIRFAPTKSQFKIYVIDECHMLTKEAFNALLKTLEEPPSHAIFILATTELHKVPSTILSRVQSFDFKKAKVSEIVGLLEKIAEKEKIAIENEALELIAKMAFGAFRDGVSMLDQVASTGKDEKITLEMVQKLLGQSTAENVVGFVKALLLKDRAAALKIIEEIYFEGTDLEHFIVETIGVLRKIILLKNGLEPELDESFKKHAQEVSDSEIVAMVEKLMQAAMHVKTSILGQLPLEMAVFELTENKNQESRIKNQELKNIIKTEEPVVKNKLEEAAEAKKGESVVQKQTVEIVKQEEPITKENKNEDETTDDIVIAESENKQPSTENQSQIFSPNLWQKVIDDLKKYNNTLAATLGQSPIVSTADNKIILAVKFKFHADRVLEKRNLAEIEKTIQKNMGCSYVIECVVDPKVEIKKPAGEEEELISDALSVFETEES